MRIVMEKNIDLPFEDQVETAIVRDALLNDEIARDVLDFVDFRNELRDEIRREVVRDDRELTHVGRVHDDLHFILNLNR